MKKKSLYLIPTLIAFAAHFATPAPAQAKTNIYGTDYYDVQELLALEESIRPEIDLACAGNRACERDYRYDLSSRGGEYRALAYMMDYPLILTSINPGLGTITIFYNSEHPELGNERTPQDISILWAEGGTNQDPGEALENVIYHVKAIKFGVMEPGIHPLFSWDENNIGFFLAGQEITMETPEAFTDNIRHQIYFKVGPTIGASIYSDCPTHLGYKDGVACKAYFGENMQLQYLPEIINNNSEPEQYIEPEEPEDSNNSLDLEIKSEQTNIKTAEPATITKIVEVPKYITVTKENKSTDNNICNQDAEDIKEVPLAGKIVKNVEFPWWLVILLIAADGLLLWWFLPTSTRNQRKHQKK